MLAACRPGGSVRLGILKYARGETSEPPSALLEKLLCEEYKITPSQLDKEDVVRMLRGMNASSFYHVARKPFDRWTPAEIKTIWDTHMKLKDLKNG